MSSRFLSTPYDENANKNSKEEMDKKLNGLTSININQLTTLKKTKIINLMDFTHDNNVNKAYTYLSSNGWNMEAALNNYIMDTQVIDQISPNDLKRMSSSEQILMAQNASKRQYFMSSTNCSEEHIANQYLMKANFDTNAAVLNYTNNEKQKNKNLTLYRMSTTEQMTILKQMENDHYCTKQSKYIGHMSLSAADALVAGDIIDHRDRFGLYRSAQIMEKWGSTLKIKYSDWGKAFWSDYGQQIHSFAVDKSITSRNMHRFNDLNIGDYIDVNPVHITAHKGWKVAEVVAFDVNRKSGQIKVKYVYKHKNYEYWVHVDNANEVALVTTMTFNQQMDRNDNNEDDIKRDIYAIAINEWSGKDIIEWIKYLENGKYKKYLNILTNGVDKQGINGCGLIAFSEKDLLNLGLYNFADRKSLYKHIKILIKTNKERFKTAANVCVYGDDEPEEYCCPITYEIMADPVILSVSGQTYERKAIEEYIKTQHQDPITLQKAQLKHIVPNRILKIIIQKWRKNNM